MSFESHMCLLEGQRKSWSRSSVTHSGERRLSVSEVKSGCVLVGFATEVLPHLHQMFY